VQDEGSEAMRTLYDGLSFDVIRNSVTFNDGSFTSNYSRGSVSQTNTSGTGNRYRYIDDSSAQDKSRSLDAGEYTVALTRYTGLQTPLYANGESVAMNRSASSGSSQGVQSQGGSAQYRSGTRSGSSQGNSATRGGSSYFGTDLIGSTRSSTDAYGSLEDRYEYDAFGKPYSGDFSTGLDVGYTGKPYDPITGLYNYGYRDYAPETVRFTTVDPVRDGNNWFAYVNNDPVNFRDEFGLSPKETPTTYMTNGVIKQTKLEGTEFGIPKNSFCLGTELLQLYTNVNGMTDVQVREAVNKGVKDGSVKTVKDMDMDSIQFSKDIATTLGMTEHFERSTTAITPSEFAKIENTGKTGDLLMTPEHHELITNNNGITITQNPGAVNSINTYTEVNVRPFILVKN